MLDERITEGKRLIDEISAFGDRLKERRRFERQALFWAATVDVRGQRCEGMIIDFSQGGARIRFDTPVDEGEELTLVLKQLDELGAKVIWRRQGEAGIQFLLAPEEVASRIQSRLGRELGGEAVGIPSPAGEPPAPPGPAYADESALRAGRRARISRQAPAAAAARSRRRMSRLKLAATSLAVLLVLAGAAAALAVGTGHDMEHDVRRILAITAGASDQHGCDALMGRVAGATNSVDFSLNVASAVNAKCIDMNHLGPSQDDLSRGIVQAAKRPVH